MEQAINSQAEAQTQHVSERDPNLRRDIRRPGYI